MHQAWAGAREVIAARYRLHQFDQGRTPLQVAERYFRIFYGNVPVSTTMVQPDGRSSLCAYIE